MHHTGGGVGHTVQCSNTEPAEFIITEEDLADDEINGGSVDDMQVDTESLASGAIEVRVDGVDVEDLEDGSASGSEKTSDEDGENSDFDDYDMDSNAGSGSD